MGDCHFDGPSPGHHAGVDEDVAGDLHRVLQVALHLVQNVLARAPQHDGARLRVLALGDVREVPVQQCNTPGHLQQAGGNAWLQQVGISHI